MSKKKYVLKTCLPLSIGEGKGADADWLSLLTYKLAVYRL